MLFDISTRLTPQVTTIICHHMEKNIIKKNIQKYGNYTKTHMLTKMIHK